MFYAGRCGQIESARDVGGFFEFVRQRPSGIMAGHAVWSDCSEREGRAERDDRRSPQIQSRHRTPYPFEHSDETTTLRDFVLPDVPPVEAYEALLHFSQSAFERLISVQMRLFARLAQAAEKIESELGLPPLPDPVPDSKKGSRRDARSANSSAAD